jgi:hypothetical protein
MVLTSAHAQVNGFMSTTARWHVAETSSANVQAFLETWTTTYGTIEDTLVSGVLWQRIVSSVDSTLNANVVDLGFVRQEGEVVLHWVPGSAPDTLYNFGLHVGDSVGYRFADFTGYIPLLAIDTVWLDGFPHRRFHFGDHGSGFGYLSGEQWIEGIGSTRGPLFPLAAREFCEEFDESLALTCFEEDGVTYWSDPDYPECVVNNVLAVGQQGRPAPEMKVWYDPATGVLRFGAGTIGLERMEVLNAVGQLMIHKPIRNGGMECNLGPLPAALYIVRATGAGWAASSRFIAP